MKSIIDKINEAIVKKQRTSEYKSGYVDLGLPSKTLWAEKNVGGRRYI